MYQPFHKLRVRFAELEMKQGEVAKRANMAESTLTARMTGRLPWKGDEIAAVAKVLGIPKGTLSPRINGKKPFDAYQISAICKVLEIKPEEIGKYFFEPTAQSGKGAA